MAKKTIEKNDPAHKAFAVCVWHRYETDKKLEKIFYNVKRDIGEENLLRLCEKYAAEVRKMSAELSTRVYDIVAQKSGKKSE